jgi:hypothetical protein
MHTVLTELGFLIGIMKRERERKGKGKKEKESQKKSRMKEREAKRGGGKREDSKGGEASYRGEQRQQGYLQRSLEMV